MGDLRLEASGSRDPIGLVKTMVYIDANSKFEAGKYDCKVTDDNGKEAWVSKSDAKLLANSHFTSKEINTGGIWNTLDDAFKVPVTQDDLK